MVIKLDQPYSSWKFDIRTLGNSMHSARKSLANSSSLLIGTEELTDFNTYQYVLVSQSDICQVCKKETKIKSLIACILIMVEGNLECGFP